MSRSLDFTLVGDGSSDRVLLHPIRWLLCDLGWTVTADHWADFSVLPEQPKGLPNRILAAARLFPARVLVVHRDAERESRAARVREIRAALARLAGVAMPAVCVVPVRMTEAWLLVDEAAVRQAAGNPNGQRPLAMPPIGQLESLPNPKACLHDLLEDACGLPARRRGRLNAGKAVQRVGELIHDYAPLRRLPAFQAFEEELVRVLAGLG